MKLKYPYRNYFPGIYYMRTWTLRVDRLRNTKRAPLAVVPQKTTSAEIEFPRPGGTTGPVRFRGSGSRRV